MPVISIWESRFPPAHAEEDRELMYEWELQKRGVRHLHFVLGIATAVVRAWAFEYVKAMCKFGGSKLFGFVDAKPLRSPHPAENAAGYLSKTS